MKEKKIIILFMLSLPFACVSQPVTLPTPTPSSSSPTAQPTKSTAVTPVPTISPTIEPTSTPSNSIQPTTIPTIQPTAYPLPANTDYNRKIIYTSNFENGFNLYSINSDGSENKKLTNIYSTISDTSPILVISPDGSKVFYSDKNLYRINVDGTNNEMLYKSINIVCVKLSRDGQFLTFSDGYENFGLYNIATNKTIKFDMKGNTPCLSPDSKEIVFSTNLGNLEYPNVQIFKMNIDGTGLKKITNDENKAYMNPKFLPDGSKIIIKYSNIETQKGGIYSINPDGTGLKLITDNADNVEISPDGKYLAYKSIGFEIYISNIDGSNPKKILDLTDKHYPVGNINWSPDSSKIVFNAQNQINTINVDGTNLKTLTAQRITTPDRANPDLIGGIYGAYSLTW